VAVLFCHKKQGGTAVIPSLPFLAGAFFCAQSRMRKLAADAARAAGREDKSSLPGF